MPTPDLARPGKVEAKMQMLKPANATAVTVLTCPADSVMRVRTVYVANTTATAQTFNLYIQRSSVNYFLHTGVTVPIKNLFNATTVDDALYLEAGDILLFNQAATSAALTLFVGYELVT
jgi:hypothetical protein